MHNPQDVECLRSKPGVVTSVFRKQVFFGVLACCWVSGAAHSDHTVVCGCGCLVGLHVNDHARYVLCGCCGVGVLCENCIVDASIFLLSMLHGLWGVG